MNRSPWPWIALLGIGVLWGWLLLRTDHGSAPAVIAAPNAPIEVTRLVAAPTQTAGPTQTPWVIVERPTGTPTPALLLCDVADDGDTCVRLPPSPTPTPQPPECRDLTPSAYNIQVCRKGDGATSAKESPG